MLGKTGIFVGKKVYREKTGIILLIALSIMQHGTHLLNGVGR